SSQKFLLHFVTYSPKLDVPPRAVRDGHFSFLQRGHIMKRFIGALFVTSIAFGYGRADDQASATVDKGIKALGGEEKLGKAKAFTWKGKGAINFGGNENAFTNQATHQGLNQYRGEFEGDFMGNKFKGVTVLNDDKAWRRFGEDTMTLDKEALANEK